MSPTSDGSTGLVRSASWKDRAADCCISMYPTSDGSTSQVRSPSWKDRIGPAVTTIQGKISASERGLLQQVFGDARFGRIFQDSLGQLVTLHRGPGDITDGAHGSIVEGMVHGGPDLALGAKFSDSSRSQIMQQQIDSAPLDESAVVATLKTYGDACMRLCLDRWSVERLKLGREHAQQRAEKLEKEAGEAHRGYMKEITILSNKVRMLQKKGEIKVEITDDDLIYYEALRCLPPEQKEQAKLVIAYKLRQELASGSNLPDSTGELLLQVSEQEALILKLKEQLAEANRANQQLRDEQDSELKPRARIARQNSADVGSQGDPVQRTPEAAPPPAASFSVAE
ncbi:unnamed protein product, partial [Polarella glacialis]